MLRIVLSRPIGHYDSVVLGLESNSNFSLSTRSRKFLPMNRSGLIFTASVKALSEVPSKSATNPTKNLHKPKNRLYVWVLEVTFSTVQFKVSAKIVHVPGLNCSIGTYLLHIQMYIRSEGYRAGNSLNTVLALVFKFLLQVEH